MCIIAFKPKGAKLPEFEAIKNCMENNPDGTGYMFNIDEGVFIHKGFTKPKELLDNLKADLKYYGKNELKVSIAIHARIATAGLVKPENCHPFPLTNNVGELQSTKTVAKRAMVHNGIISISDDKFKNLSDTQIFVKDILSQVDLSSKTIHKMLSMSIGSSKMLIFDRRGLLCTFGNWEQEGDLWYSNTTYKEKAHYYVKYSGYNSYKGWDEWDDTYDTTTKKDKDTTCMWCGCSITWKNRAYLTDFVREAYGIERGDTLCTDCNTMIKHDLGD